MTEINRLESFTLPQGNLPVKDTPVEKALKVSPPVTQKIISPGPEEQKNINQYLNTAQDHIDSLRFRLPLLDFFRNNGNDNTNQASLSPQNTVGQNQSKGFNLISSQHISTIAAVNNYKGPDSLTCLDIQPGALLPLSFDNLDDKEALNRRIGIAQMFNDAFSGVEVKDIKDKDSGALTLKDGTEIPYTLSRYTVDNKGKEQDYDILRARVKTGSFLNSKTRWIIMSNGKDKFNIEDAKDFAKKYHPRNGFEN